MDFIVFTNNGAGGLMHQGEINNVRDSREARKRLEDDPMLSRREFFIVSKNDIKRVVT